MCRFWDSCLAQTAKGCSRNRSGHPALTDWAMAFSSDIATSIHEVAARYSSTTSLCPCKPFITCLVERYEVVSMSISTIRLSCVLASEGWSVRDEFRQKPFFHRCPHDCTGKFELIATMDQWTHTISHTPKFIIVEGTVTQGMFPTVRTDVNHSGVIADPTCRRVSDPSTINAVELFSGAFSGWSQVVHHLAGKGHGVSLNLAVDHDHECRKAYSECFDAVAIGPENFACPQEPIPDRLFVESDIQHHGWLHLTGTEVVHWGLMSPPCQSWSQANAAAGLSRSEGMATLDALGTMGLIGPSAIGMENVPGMLSHPHWRHIVDMMEFFGFSLRWFPIVGLEQKLPHLRSRLLLIAIRTDRRLELQPHLCTSWKVDDLATLFSHRILMPVCDPWAQLALPSKEIMAKYLNDAFNPKHAFSRLGDAKRFKPSAAQQRVRFLHEKVECVMASYATAHELPERNLITTGLFGSLVIFDDVLRFLQVPEIICLFGAIHDVVLSQNQRIALRQLGNAIAIPHAALVICNLMAFFKPDLSQVDVLDLCQDVINARMTADAIASCMTDQGVRFFRKPDFIPMTIPMHDFVRLILVERDSEYQVWVERGINLWDALTLLFGSMQKVNIQFLLSNVQIAQIHVPKPFPMYCEVFKVSLSCGINLMVSEAVIRSTPMLTPAFALITEKGPVIMHMGSTSNVSHAIQIACDLLDFDRGFATSFLGTKIDDDCLPPYASVLMSQELTHADLTCLEMLQVSHQGSMLTFSGSAIAIEEFRGLIQESGMAELLNRLGWFFVRPVVGDSCDTEETVSLIKKPGALAVESSDVGRALVIMTFMLQINAFQSLGCEPFVTCRIRLFDDWVWTGSIGHQTSMNAFQRAWDRACRIFGKEHDLPIRMLHHGQRFHVDSPVSSLFERDSPMEQLSICIVLGMNGGGPVRLRERPELRIPPPPPLPTRLTQHESNVDIFMNEQVTYQQAITLALDMWRQCPEFLDFVMQTDEFKHLRAFEKDGMLMWEGDLDTLMSFTHSLKGIGAEKIVQRMGWILATEFVTFGPAPMAKLIIFPRPEGRKVTCALIREFIRIVLLKYGLPPRQPEGLHTIRVRILMYQVPIFQNDIDIDVGCSAFFDAWSMAADIVGSPNQVRVIANGKQAMPEFPIREYAKKGSDGSFTARIDYVLPLRGGGPNDQVTASSKSLLATFLLTQGMDLTQVSGFIESLSRVGPMAFSTILEAKNRSEKLAVLAKLANSMNIKMPELGANQQQIKKKVQERITRDDAIDVSMIRLKRDFFLNQDGSPCEQRSEPLPGGAGVCCIAAKDSEPWLNKIISQDEQIMLVVGKCPNPDPQSCQGLQVPACYKDDPIILKVCCHHLSQKKVKTQDPGLKNVVISGSEVIAITAWRDELGEVLWQKLTDSPVRVCLGILFSETEMPELVCPPWGRIFHDNQGRPVKGNASTFQFHCRVSQTDVPKVLRASGRKGVYSTPKTEQKQISSEYQIIWLQADSIQMAVAAGAQPKHLGIVRNNRNPQRMVKGLRFHRQDFETAFAELKPDDELPNRTPCTHLFKVSPIPPGAKTKDVQEWINANNWQARPIRALNANCWLCGSEKQFSCDFTHWNDQPVLIKWIQQKNANTSCILAGEPKFQQRKTATKPQVNGQMDLAFDPWKSYAPTDGQSKSSQPLASAVTRKIEAPIEDRFQSQQQDFQTLRDETNKQIAAMRTDMKSMQDHFGKAVHNFEQQQDKVQVEFQKIRSETQKQFAELGQTFGDALKQAMSQQDSSIAAQIAGLKDLLTNRPTPQKKLKPAPKKSEQDAIIEEVDDDERL